MKQLIYLFRRYKLPTILNVMGLGVALAAFYILAVQADFYATYNKAIPEAERTYRVEMLTTMNNGQWGDYVARPYEELFRKNAHVEDLQSISSYTSQQTIRLEGDRQMTSTLLTCSTHAPKFFGLQPIVGSLDDFVDGSVLIMRSEALRLFGTIDVVGQHVYFPNSQRKGTITTVVEDVPKNCIIPNGILGSYGQENVDNYEQWDTNIYLRLDDPQNKAEAEKQFLDAFLKIDANDYPPDFSRPDFNIRLTPVLETYFSGVDYRDMGNRGVVGVLIASLIFVLIVALLNFSNFSLGLAPVRIKGINTRKVLGASLSRLRLSVVMENVVWAVVAIVLGAVMLSLFMTSPTLMELSADKLDFSRHVGLCLLVAGVGLALGIVSALYPAFYASSFQPALVLKGSFALSARGRFLRSAMLTAEFVVAFLFTILIIVMQCQSAFIYNSDYGYDKDSVLFVQLSREQMALKSTLTAEARKLPFVEYTAYGSTPLGNAKQLMDCGRYDGEHHLQFTVVTVSLDYLRVMGIKTIEGRDFQESDNGAYIINESMLKNHPWLRVDEPISKQNNWMTASYRVVGVIPNVMVYSMNSSGNDRPVAFVLAGQDFLQWGDLASMMFVRIAPGTDIREAKAKLSHLLPDTELDFRILDDALRNTYVHEFRFIGQMRSFGIVSMIITLIGVFCLTMFEAEYRRKEVALRKVMGSTTLQVVLLFVSRYIWPLAISFFVAAPLAFEAARMWLQSFTIHTAIEWWVFPLSFVIVAAVVMLTVVCQCWRVATSNPNDKLRTE